MNWSWLNFFTQAKPKKKEPSGVKCGVCGEPLCLWNSVLSLPFYRCANCKKLVQSFCERLPAGTRMFEKHCGICDNNYYIDGKPSEKFCQLAPCAPVRECMVCPNFKLRNKSLICYARNVHPTTK